ncbi:MAG TPA: acyltransferase [Sulfurovum sp.]|nr:acyltransferase [Sulfurovum sp.]
MFYYKQYRRDALNKRIDYLDGLRGLAILLVLGYHAFSRWTELLPYGNHFDTPFFQSGWLGVQLFFLISGFVIFMTLDKCKSQKEFLYKRWMRLFPAMFIATILIFTTSSFFYERPAGVPELLSILPGLTFIEPEWWSKLLKTEIGEMEGAFWSLYVEFKFYVIASILFFYIGRDRLIYSLLFLFLCAVGLGFLVHHIDSSVVQYANRISEMLSLRYFGWFAAGSSFYLFYQTQNKYWFYIGIVIASISAVFVSNVFSLSSIIGALLVVVLFSVSLISHHFQFILKSKILLFFGYVSYPLYLIHENAMISMMIKTGNVFPDLPVYIYPIVPIIVLTTISYIIVKFGEPYLKSLINIKFN